MLLLRIGEFLNSILQIQTGPAPGSTQEAENPSQQPGHPAPPHGEISDHPDPHHAADIEHHDHDHPMLDHEDPLMLDYDHHADDF